MLIRKSSLAVALAVILGVGAAGCASDPQVGVSNTPSVSGTSGVATEENSASAEQADPTASGNVSPSKTPSEKSSSTGKKTSSANKTPSAGGNLKTFCKAIKSDPFKGNGEPTDPKALAQTVATLQLIYENAPADVAGAAELLYESFKLIAEATSNPSKLAELQSKFDQKAFNTAISNLTEASKEACK